MENQRSAHIVERELINTILYKTEAFHALSHPDSTKTLETIGNFKYSSPEELWLRMKADKTDIYFIFKNKDIKPITLNELLESNIQDLANRLFSTCSSIGSKH